MGIFSWIYDKVLDPIGDAWTDSMDWIGDTWNDLTGITEAKDRLKQIRAAQEHNRTAYKVKAELAALQLNEQSRADAIAAFQARSAGEAGLGASGLEGGTPFWAQQISADENTRAIKSSFNEGMIQMEGMVQDTLYNETVLGIDMKAAKRELAWAPVKAIMDAIGLGINVYSLGLKLATPEKDDATTGGASTAAARSSSGMGDLRAYEAKALPETNYFADRTPRVFSSASIVPQPAFQAKRSPLSWGRGASMRRS